MMQECSIADLRYALAGFDCPLTHEQIARICPIVHCIFASKNPEETDWKDWVTRFSSISKFWGSVDDVELIANFVEGVENFTTYSSVQRLEAFEQEMSLVQQNRSPLKESLITVHQVVAKKMSPISSNFPLVTESGHTKSCDFLTERDIDSRSFAPLSIEECRQLEAIAQYLMGYFESINNGFQEFYAISEEMKGEHRKWDLAYTRMYSKLSDKEKQAISEWNFSSLNKCELKDLQKEFEVLSLLSGQGIDSPNRLKRVAIASHMKNYYELRHKKYAFLAQEKYKESNVSFDCAKWTAAYDSIKGYRKGVLKDTLPIQRLVRGVLSKSLVSNKASRYSSTETSELVKRGDQLLKRWEVELSKKKNEGERAAQAVSVVPRAFLEEFSTLVNGSLESELLYPSLRRLASSKEAEFFLFSTVASSKEKGLVGRCADGRWMLLAPLQSHETPMGSEESSKNGRINEDLVDAFFVDNANIRTGATAYVIFRQAKIFEEDGSQSRQSVAIKCFKGVTLSSDNPISTSEWEDIQKIQGAPDVIQGLGVIKDPSNPHIVKAIVMSKLSGDLKGYMTALMQDTSAPEERFQNLYSIFSRVASSVAKMHVRGWYHNDLKPENVFLNYEMKDGKIAFSDIAIGDVSNISATHEAVDVSPEYCFRDEYDDVQQNSSLSDVEKKVIRARMDVRALGFMMYNAFAPQGQLPYEKTNRHGRREWPNTSKPYNPLPATVCQELQDLIASMLSSELVHVPTMDEVCKKFNLIPGFFGDVDLD